VTSCKKSHNDIIIAELSNSGFESFTEEQNEILAYIPAKDYNEDIITNSLILNNKDFVKTFLLTEIAEKNWNEVWESNFEPILISNRCSVRAPFHQKPENVEFDIIIEPKMSFGTGHHETTSMMISLLLESELKGKRVLDMGCGTAVLAILAEKSGAAEIIAIDNDEWAYKNSLENIDKNNSRLTHVMLGDAGLLNYYEYFDMIIANINRNILLADIHIYSQCMKEGSFLLMSGFYKEDIEIINKTALQFNLEMKRYILNNNWAATVFQKL
jgi:ribosomal protein L11 methyltransferase